MLVTNIQTDKPILPKTFCQGGNEVTNVHMELHNQHIVKLHVWAVMYNQYES